MTPRPKPKRRKASPFKAALHYADMWFSRLIILRDKRCVTCGSTDRLQCSHVFRRVRYATRWCMDAAYAQCARCHVFHHRQDETPLRTYAWQRVGQDRMDELYQQSRTTADFSADTIKAFGDSFRSRCEEMST